MDIPKCPRCGRRKSVQPQGSCGDLFRCTKCGNVFDNDPDEGGDYSDRNPAARMEREERRKKR
jgi:rubredoxin